MRSDKKHKVWLAGGRECGKTMTAYSAYDKRLRKPVYIAVDLGVFGTQCKIYYSKESAKKDEEFLYDLLFKARKIK